MSRYSDAAAARRIAALPLVAMTLATVLQSQAPTRENARGPLTDCPYRRCELTYVPTLFGGRLEVGVGVLSEVGGGFAGGGIVNAVSAVPEARAIAERGQLLQGSAQVIRIAAVIATAVLFQRTRNGSDPAIARSLAIGFGAGLFALGPLVPQAMARDRFIEATDAYNRRLPR